MSQDISVSPAAVGISCAAIGAGIGYATAPEKYSLKQLLTQEPDTFEKIIPKNVLDKAKETQKKGYEIIVNARRTVEEAVKNKKGDAKVTELIAQDELKDSFRNMKKMLPKAKVQSMVIGAFVAGVLGTLAKIIFGSSNPAAK